MEQLSAQDASFLYQETPDTPMHVGSVALLDPSESPYGPLDTRTLADFYQSRLHLMPMARRRLVHVPFNADHPYWVEDRNFDLEYHLREIALPPPGDWRQFYLLCARILGRPLDLTRPLWEVYLIHRLDQLSGIPAGAVALLTKMHHCAVDGASGTDMAIAIADLSPDMETVSPGARQWRGEAIPSDGELMMRSALGNLFRPAHAAELLAQSLGSGQRVTQLMRENLPPSQTEVPKTRFNRAVSAHRCMGFERFSLDEVRAIKNEVPGATVNDVALTICGGALRTYLERKGELPDHPLLAMAPINTRKNRDDYKLGNQVSAMFVPIGTHIADPAARLQAVREATHNAKQMTDAVGAALMTQYGEFVPAAVSNLAQRLTAEYARASQIAPAFNCSITNVPGPQVPLYMMGCRLLTTMGYGPIVHNMGLIIPISSYCGEFTISFTSCREMIPDSQEFSDCIRQSFEAMSQSALGSNARSKIDAVARNYDKLAEQALADVRATRARANASAGVPA